MKTILFVCTGNTCRSAIAEALFKNMLKETENKSIKVISAGTCAWEGDKASPYAVQAMEEKGIHIGNHSSTPLTPKLIKEADLILTMTLNHKKTVLHMCPNAEDKVFTLKGYVLGKGEDLETLRLSPQEIDYDAYDIKDPYGQSIEVYRESMAEIEKYLKKLLEKIEQSWAIM